MGPKMKRKPKIKKELIAIILSFGALILAFANCAKGTSTVPGSGTQDDTLAPTVDVWNAPVAGLVQGATLYDGWYDLRLLPDGINVAGGWSDSPAITNDGKTIYFAYTPYNFTKIVENGQFVADGPVRTGMTGNGMKNFKAHLTTSGWVVDPMLPAPFNDSTQPNLYESSLSPNAAENLVIFSRWDSNLTKASLYFTYKQPDGTWTAAQPLPSPINSSNCSNDNGFVVGDVSTGVDIYWESDRTDLGCSGGGAKKHIYHSYYNAGNGTFYAVEGLSGVNGTDPNDEDQQFYMSPDKNHVYWTAIRSAFYGLYTADLIGGSYGNARPVVKGTTSSPFTGNLVFLGEINVVETDKGWLAYFNCGIAAAETGAVHGQHLSFCRMKKNKP